MKSILIILLLVPIFTIGQEYRKKIINSDLQLYSLSENLLIHKSFTNSENYGRFPSNGAIYIRNGKALIVDTPDSEAQTKLLIEYIKDSLNAYPEVFIGCHFHSDCIGGMAIFKEMGVTTITSKRTYEICRKQNLPLADSVFTDSLSIDFEGASVVCRYFGPGHTVDNITVWFPEEKILFGGCLVKSAESASMGYTADSDLNSWPESLDKILRSGYDIKTVIPGHGNPGALSIINHTKVLLNEYSKE